MTDVVASSAAALAAAVAAAAEIAKHGGAEAFLFAAAAIPESDVLESTTTAAAAAASSIMMAEQLYDAKTTADDGDGTKKGDLTTTTACSVSPDEDDHDMLMDDDDDEEPDAEKRLARSRERNREHARRTRLRKKAQLEALQVKVKGLEAEGRTLRQALEECNIASILVGLSGGSGEMDESGTLIDDAADAAMISPPPDESKIALLVAGKRKRFISDDMMDKPSQPLKLHIDGQTTLIGGGKTHINWKTGVYSDESGVHRQLTSQQLESLRRERNRMHAKMTRDRKKCFIKTIESTIHDLERENKKLRDLISTKTITPQPSPMLTATMATHAVEEAPLCCSSSSTQSSAASSPCPSPPLTDEVSEAAQPRVTHGFSFIG